MNVIWTWLMPPCRRHRQTLSLIAAGTASEPSAEDTAARHHLDGCRACQSRFRQLESVVRLGTALTAHLPAVRPSPFLEHRWSARILAPATTVESSQGSHADLAAGQRRPARAWGLVAVLWALIAFLRFSAPEVARPGTLQPPLDWRSVSLVLGLQPARPAPKTPEPGREPTSPPSPATPAGPLGEHRPFEPVRLEQSA